MNAKEKFVYNVKRLRDLLIAAKAAEKDYQKATNDLEGFIALNEAGLRVPPSNLVHWLGEQIFLGRGEALNTIQAQELLKAERVASKLRSETLHNLRHYCSDCNIGTRDDCLYGLENKIMVWIGRGALE